MDMIPEVDDSQDLSAAAKIFVSMVAKDCW